MDQNENQVTQSPQDQNPYVQYVQVSEQQAPVQPQYQQPQAAIQGEPYPNQPYQGQPSMSQPYQPYQAQPNSNQPYQAQPYQGQPYPNQPYQGQPYPYMAPQAPMNRRQPAYTPEESRKAKILCIISLILYLVPYAASFLTGVFSGIYTTAVNSSYDLGKGLTTAVDAIWAILGTLSGGSQIGAVVLMIIARVKYPKYVFAKVLMWIYIVSFIIAVITVALFIYFIVSICSQCPG